MASISFQKYEIATSGATITFNVDAMFDALLLTPETDPLTLSANLVVNFTTSTSVSEGRTVSVIWSKGIDLDGNTFTINGVSVTQIMADNDGQIDFVYKNSAWTSTYVVSMQTAQAISGASIKDGTINLTKLEALTSARIIVGNASNVPTAVAVTGDVTISNAGVTSIASDKITDAMVKSNAAIARTKLASGTAAHVVINSGSGEFSSEAQLSPSRGGTGLNNSSATGFQKWNGGTSSVGAVLETMIVPVSFESGEVGTIFIDFPYACTILSYQFVCTKALAGTDAGTIQFADNAGTNMTGGLATIPASTAFGTRVGATITAGGDVALNDDIRITTAKTTAGGRGFVSITLTRLS